MSCKKTLLDLAENFGNECTWLCKLNVWLYKVGEKTILTSDKGYAFIVNFPAIVLYNGTKR